MDKALKQRMVGAVVLIALGVIFIPMLLDGGSRDESRTVELDIPEPPDPEYRSRLLPLDESQGERGQVTEGRVSRQPTPSPGTESSSPGNETPAQPAEQHRVAEAPAEDPRKPAATAGESTGTQASESADVPEEDGSPMGNWFVQVGSFSQQANARDLRDRLRNAGYTAFVETSTVEGKTTHRVKVGPEMDRARSERVRKEIQSEFDLKGIVVSEP